MKIFLAELHHNFTHGQGGLVNALGYNMAPYGIASIAAYATSILGDDMDISLFKFANDLLAAVESEHPDVIAFSNYVWNTQLNHSIGSALRATYPDILMVAGGPSVRTDPEGIATYLRHNPFVDICVLQEGEVTFAAILSAFMKHRKGFMDEQLTIPGAAYFSGSELVFPGMAIPADLGTFPSPYLNGYLDDFLAGGRMTPIFETNRGCPFGCAYCAWGIASLNKVRQMPMERVMGEFDYVARTFPNIPQWYLADANFGLLERDIDIAGKLRSIRMMNPALRSVFVCESKNTTGRSIEIANILREGFLLEGHQTDSALIALQTLDKTAQEYSNRSNIHLTDIPERIKAFRASGAGVRTDLLSGLPGDTYESHLETLRKVFDFGFDHVGIYNVVLLPGAEMETKTYRERHKIRSRFRPRAGCFGEYSGLRSIEAEEAIVANAAIQEEDLLTLRLVHWAIWYGWNHLFLKPVLNYAFKKVGKNPADVLCQMVVRRRLLLSDGKNLFDTLRERYVGEFYETSEDLHAAYYQDERWSELKKNDLTRVGFDFNARLINDRGTFKNMLAELRDIVVDSADPAEYDEIADFMLMSRIEPSQIVDGSVPADIKVSMSAGVADVIVGDVAGSVEGRRTIHLRKSVEQQDAVRTALRWGSYETRPLSAILKTLGSMPSAFFYDVRPSGGSKPGNG